MPKEFYIQDKRQTVGNSMTWWRKGGLGYGCDIRQAEVFSEERAKSLIAESGYKYRAWPKEYIDARVSHHIDFQHCDTDEGFTEKTRTERKVCHNCEEMVPPGCGGQFRDDGASCALNADHPKSPSSSMSKAKMETDEIVHIPGAVAARRSVIEAKRAERLVELQRAREWLAAAIADGWVRQTDSTDTYHKLERGEFVAHVIVREDSTIGWRLPEGSVYVWGNGGFESIETPWPYSWEAITAKFCGHDYEHLGTVANCLNRYRCRKCGAVHDIDSSD